MSKNYFNKWEFNQANSLVNSNPFEAKLRFEEYLEKYPKDYSAYTYYCFCLITLNKLDEAEKILNFVEILYKKDSNFCKNSERIKILESNIISNRIKLLSYKEQYEELLQLCLNIDEDLSDIEVDSIILYCKKKLGKLDSNKRGTKPYLFRQIIDYREDDFLNHLLKHLAHYNKNLNKRNKNIFVPNFQINEIILEVKKYIPSNKRIFHSYLDDTYIFKYNECGRDNNKLVNYFKVVCFHNTSDIITICPLDNCEKLPYVDLNYLIKEVETTKVKRLSQTEKFYQKYKQNSKR